MKLRSTYLAACLLVLMLFTACASVQPVDQTAMLRTELMKWQQLSGEGIAELNYMGFSLRKMFILGKSQEAIRLDILDGGALAVGASPFASIYLQDYLTIQSDAVPQIEFMSRAKLDTPFTLGMLADVDSLVATYGDAIIADRRAEISGISISFSPELRIQQITEPVSGAQITFTYTPKGDPDTILFAMDSSTSVKLLFDKVVYGDPNLVPLPRISGASILEQFLEPDTMRDATPAEE